MNSYIWIQVYIKCIFESIYIWIQSFKLYLIIYALHKYRIEDIQMYLYYRIFYISYPLERFYAKLKLDNSEFKKLLSTIWLTKTILPFFFGISAEILTIIKIRTVHAEATSEDLVMDTNDAADYSHDSRYLAECAWPEANLETAVNVLKQILRFLYIREREREGMGLPVPSTRSISFD